MPELGLRLYSQILRLREGRKFIGAELNPEYAAMAVERIGLGAEIG